MEVIEIVFFPCGCVTLVDADVLFFFFFNLDSFAVLFRFFVYNAVAIVIPFKGTGPF